MCDPRSAPCIVHVRGAPRTILDPRQLPGTPVGRAPRPVFAPFVPRSCSGLRAGTLEVPTAVTGRCSARAACADPHVESPSAAARWLRGAVSTGTPGGDAQPASRGWSRPRQPRRPRSSPPTPAAAAPARRRASRLGWVEHRRLGRGRHRRRRRRLPLPAAAGRLLRRAPRPCRTRVIDGERRPPARPWGHPAPTQRRARSTAL